MANSSSCRASTASIPVFVPALTLLICRAGNQTAVNEAPQDPFDLQRAAMVERQLAGRDIGDAAVLAAMRAVPRHEFVPPDLRVASYQDEPLPIGLGQTISQPYIVALMTQLARVDSTSKVLEVGTGSGYQSAVLAEIADSVFTLEIVEALCSRAASVLQRLGYKNIAVKCGDGYRGWSEHAPFDAILVTAAPDHVPQPLIEQLAIGGRLIIPVGDRHQELLQIVRSADSNLTKSVIPVRFVPMTGEALDQ